MSPALHLETDTVRGLVSAMKSTGEIFANQSTGLVSAAGGMDWTSPGRAYFDDDIASAGRLLNDQGARLQELAQRLESAVQRWETAAASLAQSSAGAAAGDGQSEPPAETGDWDAVIASADPEGKLQEKPSVMEVIHGIYDILEEVMGKLFAKNFLTTWIKGIGFIPDSIDLMTSSQSVSETSEQWRKAMDQYGPNSPEALQARSAYSSAELSQIITPLATTIIKAGGKWEELIQMYEDFKYER